MTKVLRVSGIQMPVTIDVLANETRLLAAIEYAARDRADFLITPEGALSGYYADFDGEEVADALDRVVAAAAEAKVGLALGTCFKELVDGEEHCYNQVRVYSPEGDYLGFHSKILRCSPLDPANSGEMLHYAEVPLRVFRWNDICFGALICNDLWATPGCTTIPNPYLPWQLKLMGAQVIFHEINSGVVQVYRPFHESSVNLWARSLRIHIVGVNAAGRENETINCTSGVVAPDGSYLVSSLDKGEHYFTCEIPLDTDST